MTWPTFRHYLYVVVAGLAVELLSWAAYRNATSELWTTIVLTTALLVVAWKRPTWLAYLSLGELVIGGKGRLFFLPVGETEIPMRMILFSITLVAAWPSIRRRWSSLRGGLLSTGLIAFACWLIVATAIGLLQGNGPGAVYRDANAFLFLALLPAWWALLTSSTGWSTRVIAILLGLTTVIGLKGWLMVLLFGQDLGAIRTVYLWIRNTGVGEVTFISGNAYRVFFQSHIYSLLVLLFTIVLWVRHRPPRWWLVPLGFAALGTYVSLSRSFWLGGLVAAVALVGWLVRQREWPAFRRLLVIVPAAVFAWAMVVWALSFPTFDINGRTDIVGSRLGATGTSEAADARRNQLQPLVNAISVHPVIGSGFGRAVTYYSTDPTVRGWRTTNAFELGYFDLWLKIGGLGLLLFGWWVASLWRRSWIRPLGPAVLFGGVALVTVHLTTPYLNHPLGLGWMFLTALVAYDS